jgi:hypothetical protein
MGMFNRASRAVFAVVMVGLGVVGLISGNSPAAVDGLVKAPETLSGPRGHGELGGVGELAATSAGGWCLLAAHAGAWVQRHLKFAVGESGIRSARLLLIAALPMIGLSHFVYHDLTASLVPKWMSFPIAWTYLTGAGSLAAAAGMLSIRVSRRTSRP